MAFFSESRLIRKILLGFLGIIILCGALLVYLAYAPIPKVITYGMSFNSIYARELGLNPPDVLRALLEEMKIKHLRLAAHWTLVEPAPGMYDWTEIDTELSLANTYGADVIMGVGRRLPRWPECHVPEWARTLSWEDQKKEIRELITMTVTRYRDNSAIVYWQVENEPFLSVFAHEHCGDLDRDFLREEIELVRSLDPTRPILVTDSGNLGTWIGAFRSGDAFGTSVYVYFWNPELGKFKTILPAWAYRVKENALGLFFGDKKTFLIELSLEPWLLEPVTNVPLDVQYSRMNPDIFREIISYARDTRFDTQYLWGGEWWYWLRERNKPEMWNMGKELFERGSL
jgi:hypothetical protein